MTHRNPPASLSPLLLLIGLCLAAAAAGLSAQGPTPYTLHVYANRIQVPTLVLRSNGKPLPPLPISSFNISLDSGPSFHPSRAYREGDEPINLAILLDASGDQNILLKNFGKALASLAPRYLRPQDHISMYALDCTLVRSFSYMPADSVDLRSGVSAALSAPTLHGKSASSACAKDLHLWDAIISITKTLSVLPGRRVLLVLSDGYDTQSYLQWANVMQVLNDGSVALFGMQDPFQFMSAYPSNQSDTGPPVTAQDAPTDLFTDLCRRNGGTVLATPQKMLTQNLQKLITMLRDRYILEFPRSDKFTPGLHSIDITIPRLDAFIAITGVTVPLPDAKILADPTTVPTTPSQATFGNRRPLDYGH